MPTTRHVVPAPLRPFVAAAYGYRVPANPAGVHRGLPSRHLTLVVELAGPLRVDGPGPAVAAHAVVGGLHTRPALIDATRPQDGLQYALTPSAAGALLGVPAAELAGRTVDLADLLGRDADRLVEDLTAAAGWPQRFARLDAALLDRLPARPVPVPPEVREAWRLVHRSAGRCRVEDVAAHVGWSRRHLAERFRLATGLTPKQAARVARFEAARRLLTGPGRPPLAEVAARCGYADQPHLAREWKALAGCSVGTWLREELPFVHDGEADGTAPSRA
ncbi:AraC-type DNA-binding protein [Geodermatophilus pulveris]|uniref:AraC-type DNA-binding protein n=1 Tax=Geodermatophilus pulveris TaxID=1564159 RepID=A0A239DTV2_9ACTN|nr:helix-turn-helix transcriptional regulator [Geodermatophilus pulveris]SNS35669.1 AraC-type DNA-binding protein [Geodermatophilus pulveris]